MITGPAWGRRSQDVLQRPHAVWVGTRGTQTWGLWIWWVGAEEDLAHLDGDTDGVSWTYYSGDYFPGDEREFP